MTGIARHLFRFPSPLDGRSSPYLVCSPEPCPTTPLPAIILLHDTLDPPTAEGFIEEGYRLADQWIEPLSQSPPALLVLPYGRGNGGWIGAGGADLLTLLACLPSQFPVDSDAISLCGTGAGGTGALLLGAWFADRFSAVAAIGAWTDANLDLPVGSTSWLEWEMVQRAALSPVALAENLRHLPIHLEHPWWRTGVGQTADPEHSAALHKVLEDLGAEARFVDADSVANGFHRDSPVDRVALCRWLSGNRRRPLPERCAVVSPVPRVACCPVARITGSKQGPRPARVDCRWDGRELRLKTRGVDELEVVLPLGTAASGFRIDRQDFPATDPIEAASAAAMRLERVTSTWHALPGSDRDPQRDESIKTPQRGGPVMDLFWGPLLLVHGTLGDEPDNERMAQFVANLRDRWVRGEDSHQPYPGNRALAVDYRVTADTQVSDTDRTENSLVLVGNPRNNLLLARFAARLPARWESRPGRHSRQDGPPGISLNGRWYADPDDVAFFICPNPESADRYLFVIAVNDTKALARASRVRTAYLPDFFVHRGEKVLDWGYFGADWSLMESREETSLAERAGDRPARR